MPSKNATKVTIGGKTYYFKGNGAMATGWLNPSGWYYFDAHGVMKKGWLKDGGAIVCLPNGVEIRIAGDTAVDAVIQ